jgi:hypothetical protein
MFRTARQGYQRAAERPRLADLTVLAKNNNGAFPYNRVYEMIDGRNSTISSHGTREMLQRCK